MSPSPENPLKAGNGRQEEQVSFPPVYPDRSETNPSVTQEGCWLYLEVEEQRSEETFSLIASKIKVAFRDYHKNDTSAGIIIIIKVMRF